MDQNLPTSSTDESATKPHSNLPKILLLSSLGLFVVGGSVFAAYQFGKSSQPTSTAVIPSPITAVSSSPSPVVTKKPILTESFRGTLNKYCKEVSLGQGATFNGIPPHDLPITYDENLITPQLTKGLVYCGSDKDNLDSFYLNLGDNKNYKPIYFYDDKSEELGHGGLPYWRSLPTVIGAEGDITYSISINTSDVGIFVKGSSVTLRGEKKMVTANGESFYAAYSEIAIPATDKRLVDILIKKSAPSEIDPGSTAYTGTMDEANRELKNLYFQDLDSLTSTEKVAFENISKILNAISVK
jgi:hypothetical protein